MLKKLYVIFFIVFAYFVFEMAFTFSILLDTTNIIRWFDQPGYIINQLDLSANLGGESPSAVIKEIIELSDMLAVNVFVRTSEIPSPRTPSKTGLDLKLYAYLQDDEYLSSLLPVHKLQVATCNEFNYAENQVITNAQVANKIGHLVTTTNENLYTISPLPEFDPDELISQIYITHKQEHLLTIFIQNLQHSFPELNLDVMSYEQYTHIYSLQGSRFYIGYLIQVGRASLIASIFLLLTIVLYLFNIQREIIIEKIHGMSNIRILLRHVMSMIIPALAWAAPMGLLFHFIFNGLINLNMLVVFGMYVVGLALVSLICLLFSLSVILFIAYLKPVNLLKHKQGNLILISSSLVIKAITIPLIIISLSGSVYNLSNAIKMRTRLVNYQNQYNNYIQLVGGSLSEYVSDQEGKTYITQVYEALNSAQLAIYFDDGTHNRGFDNIPLRTTYGFTNSNYVNKNRILDSAGSVINLEPNKEYVLVPERYYDDLINILYDNKYKIYLPSFVPAAFTDKDPFSLTDEEIEEEVISKFIKIADYQNIPSFDIYHFNSPEGTLDDYILIVSTCTSVLPQNADQIFLDVRDLDKFQDDIDQVLSEHGLPAALGYARATELMDLYILDNKAVVLKAFRESLIYLILLVYISYLTTFFYFMSSKREVAIKILHGIPIFTQFRSIFILNLTLDYLVFLFLIVRGSYLGHTVEFGVARGIYPAFVFLLFLDAGILLLSIQSFKTKSLQLFLKDNF